MIHMKKKGLRLIDFVEARMRERRVSVKELSIVSGIGRLRWYRVVRGVSRGEGKGSYGIEDLSFWEVVRVLEHLGCGLRMYDIGVEDVMRIEVEELGLGVIKEKEAAERKERLERGKKK